MKHTITSLIRTPRLALAMLPLFALPAVAADPAAVLPDEPVAYMEMDSNALGKLSEHPVAKTLPVEKLEEMMYKLSQMSREESEKISKQFLDELGKTEEELQKMTGRVAVSIHDLDIPAEPSPENVGAEMSMAFELDADEAFMEKLAKAYFKLVTEAMAKQAEKQGGPDFDEVIKKMEEVFEHSTVEHEGAKIHVWKVKDTEQAKGAPKFIREWAYTLHDKMFLLSSGQDGVEEMIGRLKSGANTGSLAASALYKKDHEKAGPTLGMASLNLEVILGLVEKYALPQASGAPVDVEKVWKALGADKLQSAVMAFGAGADYFDVIGLMTYSEKPGLFKVPAIPGSGKAPEFLPKSLTAASYQQVDIGKTVDNLIKLVIEIYPEAEQYVEMGLTAAKGRLGVDIKADILGQLGPDMWVAQSAGGLESTKPGGGSGLGAAEAMLLGAGKSVIGLRVKDKKAFSTALETVFNSVGSKDALLSEREYQGHTINEIKESPEEFRVAYVLTDEWLMLSLGGGEVLEQILGRLGKSGDDGFFAQPKVAKTLDGMRGGQGTVSVSDLGETIGALFDLMAMAVKNAPAGAPEIPFDELAKLLRVPLWSVDKAWIEDGHMEYRMRIVPKGE